MCVTPIRSPFAFYLPRKSREPVPPYIRPLQFRNNKIWNSRGSPDPISAQPRRGFVPSNPDRLIPFLRIRRNYYRVVARLISYASFRSLNVCVSGTFFFFFFVFSRSSKEYMSGIYPFRAKDYFDIRALEISKHFVYYCYYFWYSKTFFSFSINSLDVSRVFIFEHYCSSYFNIRGSKIFFSLLILQILHIWVEYWF